MLELDDLERLKKQIQSLTRMRKQQMKLSEKSLQDLTPKQAQKASADQSWLGMEIDKAAREAHAAAVDLGIADPRSAESYGPVDYRPSAFHHYRHQPTKPRCRAA
ncbi:hypothetical protein [Ponticoccus litoralis]|uniref:Uncharacterized protein n=1 Tax=Ponticoccus litoralis TaxID=422297 RepID=A0AAW9SMI5_9RHOB